jgi:hypothetical protein
LSGNSTITITLLTVSNTLTIGSGSTITHPANSTAGLTIIASNLNIQSGGSINTNSKGYPGGYQASGSGPGGGTGVNTNNGSSGGGGGYGGKGGNGYGNISGGSSYGSLTQPTDLGSGGGGDYLSYGGAGGGAIKLVISGTLTVNGTISANGGDGTSGSSYDNGGGGSGGSIWIQTGTISGSGTISANGGNGAASGGSGYAGGGGAGGRIAIYYTTYNFTGSVTAYGGTGYQNGSLGTIYTSKGKVVAVSDISNILRLGADRHTFYDGTNYWVFYIDVGGGGKVAYETSSDGVLWVGSANEISSWSNCSSLGIWEDGTSVWTSYECSLPNWLSGWSYRRPITISNIGNNNALTDYQVKIDIPYDSDMKSDFSDLRFTKSDGTTLLNYWIESYTPSATATVWIKVPSIPANSTTSIYMYYGNPSATTTSSGDNTFLLFDDFETDRGWTYSENGSAWSGGYTTDQYVSPTHSYYINYPPNTGSGSGYYGRITKTFVADGTTVRTELKVKDDYTGATSGYHFKQVYLAGTLLWEDDVAGDEGGWVSVSVTSTPAAGPQSFYLQVYDKAAVSNFGINVWWDDVKIRKYTSPEPTGSVGSEETTPSPAPTLYTRKITISDKTLGTEYSVTSSGVYHPQIIKDSNNYLWIKGESTTSNFYVRKSTNPNDNSSWQTETLIGSDTSGFGHLMLVPMTGGKIMAIYNNYDGTNYNLMYRVYDPSSGWSSATTVVSDCKDNTNSVDWSVKHWFSAVSDSSGNVHLIYVDSDNDDLNYTYYNGSSWSSPVKIYQGTVSYPSLSIDNTNNLYAFFIEDNSVKYKVSKGTNWDESVSVLKSNLNSPAYLGSAYSDNLSIGVVWREIDSYDVTFAQVLVGTVPGSIWLRGGVWLRGGIWLK